MTPPLIVLNAGIGDNSGSCLYDPGSNLSAISKTMLKKCNIPFVPLSRKFHTMGGEETLEGVTMIDLRVLNQTKRVMMFVIDSKKCKYDFIIGLDLIPRFGLNLDYELNISQVVSENNVEIENRALNNVEFSPSSSKIINQVNWNEFIPVEKFESKIAHLHPEKREAIRSLINKFGSVFAKDSFDVGTVRDYEAHIVLSENRYISRKPYRCSY